MEGSITYAQPTTQQSARCDCDRQHSNSRVVASTLDTCTQINVVLDVDLRPESVSFSAFSFSFLRPPLNKCSPVCSSLLIIEGLQCHNDEDAGKMKRERFHIFAPTGAFAAVAERPGLTGWEDFYFFFFLFILILFTRVVLD